jgi:aryl-alcohol dehydrogenase-like predicted oxidoreductase
VATISTISGEATTALGLAAYPEQSPDCVRRAFDAGVNFFFLYGLGSSHFVKALATLAQVGRDAMIVACGSESRTRSGLRAVRRKTLSALGIETIDIFFAEYVNPDDGTAAIFGQGGVLDELRQWKAEGAIRYVGASAHDRKLAKKLAADGRVDILMHRYNMAHRKAEAEVFPTALESQTPVIAFTATRWGTLLLPHSEWPGARPTAADCYRFCLAQPAVHVTLTSPKSVAELDANLEVLKSPPMDGEAREKWERFGDLVYNSGGAQNHDFESQWP